VRGRPGNPPARQVARLQSLLTHCAPLSARQIAVGLALPLRRTEALVTGLVWRGLLGEVRAQGRQVWDGPVAYVARRGRQ
jgi:hypothetical protein